MWVSLCVGVLGGGCHTVGVGLPPGQHLPTPKHHFGDMQDLARWSCNWWFSSLHLEFRLICTFCAFLVCAPQHHYFIVVLFRVGWSVILSSVCAAVWGVVQCSVFQCERYAVCCGAVFSVSMFQCESSICSRVSACLVWVCCWAEGRDSG